MLEPESNYLPEEEIIPPKKITLDKNTQRKIAVTLQIALLFLLLLVIGYYAYYFFSGINQSPLSNISPTPSINVLKPSPILKFSKWATESALLNEEKNLQNLENEIKSLDLNETDLNFPSLNFSLNFKEN